MILITVNGNDGMTLTYVYHPDWDGPLENYRNSKLEATTPEDQKLIDNLK